MASVAAVRTTGIYCRPGCAARPHPENVVSFPLAAAAEAAGYRACLRCRPYRVPPAVGWDVGEMVCRAVRLILAGALDRGTEAELGARLGISARHLRRLFVHHLGVTPDGLARSARAHFARRLLDECELSITEIAFAAGFRSVRQFNRTCRHVFKATPTELRARARRADRLAADGGLALRLSFDGRLDWQATVDHLAARAVPGVEAVAGACYRRTILVGDDPGVIELAPADAQHLLLVAHLPHWEELRHLVARARAIANLDLEMDETALRADPTLRSLRVPRSGVRVPGAWDGFEVAVLATAGRGVPAWRAHAALAALVARFGRHVPGLAALGLTHLFPSPEALARVDLGTVGLTRDAARIIGTLADAVVSGSIALDGSMRLSALVAALCDQAGVDVPTAHYVALRLGERDVAEAGGSEPLVRSGTR